MAENKQPLIAIDVAPLHFDGETLNVILGKRQYEPFQGEYSLPGVLLILNETLKEAAERAIRTKIGYTSMSVTPIKQVGTYDNSDRDPRGPTISVLSYGIVREVIANHQDSLAFPVKNIQTLPFDHNELLKSAIERLAETAFTDEATLKSLLGKTFTTASARKLANELNIEMNQTNITRFLRGIPFIQESEGTALTPGQKGRPSKVWSFKND